MRISHPFYPQTHFSFANAATSFDLLLLSLLCPFLVSLQHATQFLIILPSPFLMLLPLLCDCPCLFHSRFKSHCHYHYHAHSFFCFQFFNHSIFQSFNRSLAIPISFYSVFIAFPHSYIDYHCHFYFMPTSTGALTGIFASFVIPNPTTTPITSPYYPPPWSLRLFFCILSFPVCYSSLFSVPLSLFPLPAYIWRNNFSLFSRAVACVVAGVC